MRYACSAICVGDWGRSWASNRRPSSAGSSSNCSSGEGTGEQGAVLAGNLPTPLSSFVGRQPEIDEITGLLSRARLVSLSELRRRRQDASGDRRGGAPARSVRLRRVVRGPVADHRSRCCSPETFIAGVGIPATAACDSESYLHAALATRQALVVVDNCEHLGAAVGQLIDRLLRAERRASGCWRRAASASAFAVRGDLACPAVADRTPQLSSSSS